MASEKSPERSLSEKIFISHPDLKAEFDYRSEGREEHMAVAEKTSTQLRLVFFEGDNVETGNPMYKYKTLNNVKQDASTEQLFETGAALASLQASPLHNIERKDSFNLYRE